MAQVNLSAEIKTNSRNSSISRMRGKAQGFVIEDSVNNIPFGVDRPILDTSRFLMGVWMKEFKAKYGNELDVLPWHFVVEMNEDSEYMIHVTRPISQKFPASRDWYDLRIRDDAISLDRPTDEFLNQRRDKDLQDMIHILVLGDSNIDVYGRDIYKRIGSYIIGPLSRVSMISPVANLFALNMGEKFNMRALVTAATSGA